MPTAADTSATSATSINGQSPAPPAAVDEGSDSPNVLLVTFDTTRSDRIGAYGHAAAHTPTLDRLASEGLLFERALAPTPLTLPSHASILTGLFPQAHGVHDNTLFRLSPEEVAIAEVFREEGWRTGAFVGSVVLDAHYGLDQGFEVYHGLTGSISNTSSVHERYAADVVDDFTSWISSLDANERFFAWVHFYDPHYKYSPPEPWRSREDPYDAEIAYADDQLGRLLRFLENRGSANNLLIAVTADHGESLGEHGEETHAIFIYQSTMQVPLIFWGHRIQEPAGTRVASSVSNVATAASLLALAGVGTDAIANSEASLFTADGKLADTELQAAILLESHFPYNSHRWRALRGLVVGGRKLIDGGTPELYDLDADAFEQTDLADGEPQAVAALAARLETEFALRASSQSQSTRLPSAGERAQLAALGYAIGSARGDPLEAGLPDPRDRIGDKKLMLDAIGLLTEGERLRLHAAHEQAKQAAELNYQAQVKFKRARAMLSQIVEANSRDVFALARLGIAEGRLENFDRAVELLEGAARDEPEQPWIRESLARAYADAGRNEEAAREMEGSIAIDALKPENYEWLIEYYTSQNQPAAARKWLEALANAHASGSREQRAVARRLEALDP